MTDARTLRSPVERPLSVRCPFTVNCEEAPTGVEPVMEVLQTSALPLGYGAEGPNIAG